MTRSRLTGFLLSAALAVTSAAAAGCNREGAGAGSSGPLGDTANIQALPSQVQTAPLLSQDFASFEAELFRSLNISPDLQKQFRILETQDTANGTYVLYSLPNHDGMAFAGRHADGRVLLYKTHWPLVATDSAQDPVVVRAVPPNNNINPGYGVLAGRVYNPFIETIEVHYRDGHKERVDVSHTRGFLLVRPAFDPRFVAVRGYGTNGNPYWTIDTR